MMRSIFLKLDDHFLSKVRLKVEFHHCMLGLPSALVMSFLPYQKVLIVVLVKFPSILV